ncbi:hypothetical protein K469DRAFT_717288 [Zopfia rhizophila CBS 207.26]|uniref:Uncharacterized protein n=1 Tax=Zopfia rhizophila CBS 207.26 TaxID=1314779 RepID=A0A6A6ENW3_9PEZI|nr:hypothetical protein K469DRAFT_717288 [Zopfia rhizophila CBS 207.26]
MDSASTVVRQPLEDISGFQDAQLSIAGLKASWRCPRRQDISLLPYGELWIALDWEILRKQK